MTKKGMVKPKYVGEEEASEAIKKRFPKGAKVRLNVGGPVMAVKGYSYGAGTVQEIVCQWFSGKDKAEKDDFPPESLILVKDDAEESKKPPAP